MKLKLTAGAALALVAVALYIFLAPSLAHSEPKAAEASTTPAVPTLSPEQQTWEQALRYCESRGFDGAVNKVDRDGTPSYGRYQFKPGTFAAYASHYDVAATKAGVMDGNVQQAILDKMVLDKTITAHQWKYSLFPDCVQRFVGLPPIK